MLHTLPTTALARAASAIALFAALPQGGRAARVGACLLVDGRTVEHAVADVRHQRAAAGMTAVPRCMSSTNAAYRPSHLAIHAVSRIDRSHAHV